MGLLEKLKVWALTGAKVKPDDSDIFDGWGYLERPPRQHWNWVEYTRDTKINDLVDIHERLKTFPPAADVKDLCSRVGPRWDAPDLSPNTMWTGGVIKDSCIGWDWTNNRPVIYILDGFDNIRPVDACWQYDSDPTQGDPLSLSYGSTPDDILAICSDGEYLYVVWCLDAGNIWMSKFSLVTFTGTAVWNADLGVLTANIKTTAPSEVKCTIGNDTYVCVVMGADTAGQPEIIASVAKSDGATTTGNGTSTSNEFFKTGADLISDGTTVFWITVKLNTPYEFYIESATIATPGSSGYSSLQIATAPSGSPSQFPLSLALVRDALVAFTMDGTFYVVPISEWDVENIFNLDNWIGFGGYQLAPAMISDGLNLWAFNYASYAPEGVDVTAYTFTKVPVGMFSWRARRAAPPWDIPCETIYIDAGTYTDEQPPGRMLFDGQDVWFLNYTGRIYRIVNPAGR